MRDVTVRLVTALDCIGFYFKHHRFIDEKLKNVYKIFKKQKR